MNKSEIFRVELINKSTCDNFQDALAEFVLHRIQRENGSCICTQSIVNQCLMLNVVKCTEIVVGNCCVRKFMAYEHRSQLKALERKTYDCGNCGKKRIQKEVDSMDELCSLCDENCKKCVDCSEYFLCQGDRRQSYCDRFLGCYASRKGGNAVDVHVYRFQPRRSN